MTGSTPALDRFFEHYYRRRPVNATFTGLHDYDARLPEWSPDGLAALDDEMDRVAVSLRQAYRVPASPRECLADPDVLDAQLALDFLAIQRAENDSGHGVRGNPALWTGEAIFSIVSLMIRDFAPIAERVANATARLEAMPAFIAAAKATLTTVRSAAMPAAWIAKALRECAGGEMLFTLGLERWVACENVSNVSNVSADAVTRLADAAFRARRTLAEFATWLRGCPPAQDETMACGADLYDHLLARGHRCVQPRPELLAEAKERLQEERATLDALACAAAGSLAAARERIASDHPAPDEYLAAFERIWTEAREVAQGLVTWPDWPIRYTTYPESTCDAAPYLYYLHYRSPAPFDRRDVHDYVVPALPVGREAAHLRTWNHSVIKLNHVVHHGGIGHHVQNWHAYHQTRSRIGRIAAVDCASRIGMFCGGSMAEGWACYATRLMDELGFLRPLERVAERETRVRMLARAIVDIELHEGTMAFGDAARFYVEQAGMTAEAARAEAVKNTMFPCTAVMYWLGTQGIVDLRTTLEAARGAAWSLKDFHDELLGFGSIPVLLVAGMLA